MVVLTLEAQRDLKLLGKFNSWLKLNLNKKICNGLSKEHDIRIEETFFSFIPVCKYAVQYCPINVRVGNWEISYFQKKTLLNSKDRA